MSTSLFVGKQNETANTVETFYSATLETRIDSFTAANSTGALRSYEVFIYDPSGPLRS